MKRTNIVFLAYLMMFLISCNSQQTENTTNSKTVSIETVKTAETDSALLTDSSPFPDSTGREKGIAAVSSGNETNRIVADNHSVSSSAESRKNNNKEPVQAGATEKQPISIKSEAKKFCDFFKTVDEPSQFYTVPANQIKEVRGKSGTVILVNPDDLVTLNNQSVNADIEVELKELINQEQLLKANAQTVCNGKLLVSGGAYYINLKSEGNPVKIKNGKSLSVKFPKLTEAPMALFSGYRDTLGQMQWQKRNLVFRDNDMRQAWRDSRNTIIQYDDDILRIDTFPKRKPNQKTEKEKQLTQAYEKVYAAMDVQSLGWINCDRFYNVQDKTSLFLTFDPHIKIPFASIYLVFDDINSITQTHYGATENGVANPGFENIPVGAKARLIAFSLKGDQLMAYSSPITIKKNETVSISLKETSDEELQKLLKR